MIEEFYERYKPIQHVEIRQLTTICEQYGVSAKELLDAFKKLRKRIINLASVEFIELINSKRFLKNLPERLVIVETPEFNEDTNYDDETILSFDGTCSIWLALPHNGRLVGTFVGRIKYSLDEDDED